MPAAADRAKIGFPVTFEPQQGGGIERVALGAVPPLAGAP
jgi:hypothetical protein